ncbi:Het-s 218-289-domain-containing protein [Dactylonectria macrodidyma]|uniref:Het-s 218-289-domain-containing protein n=1 Tax=Dactylonectria macrodidyma TaxID=307937 RepID=A0A9P9FTM0_9HYPO|nr:Het-s 218-289-domain-containing protein [Dactylonectria macrodidyma]
MAEIFGIATGALSYIQLGRHFGEDYQRCQPKLDIAETRLGRWDEAVGVNNDARFASASPPDKAVKGAQGILEDITDCFEAARRNQADMQRARKAAWALYDGKSLEKIVEQISSWVDELEKLFPVEAAHQNLVEMEIEEVDDELSLRTLKGAARGIDPALEDAVGRKVDAIEAKNNAGSVKTEDLARFQLGNVFSEGALRREILVKDQTNNSVETVSAKNESRVQIGNIYGGKGIWDD